MQVGSSGTQSIKSVGGQGTEDPRVPSNWDVIEGSLCTEVTRSVVWVKLF